MPLKKYRWPIAFLVLGVIAILFALWTKTQLVGFQEAEKARIDAANGRYAELVANDAAAREAVARALADGTLQSLKNAVTVAESVSDPARRQLLLGTLLPKRLEALGGMRDKIISEAADLQDMNQDDPQIFALIEQARPFQDESMALLKDLERDIEAMRTLLTPEEWKTWRASLRYLEGYTEYSRLNFLKPDEEQKAKDAVQKSLDAYSKVFIDFPKDARTEYAIESLYQAAKKQSQDSQGQKNGKGKKPQLVKRPSGPSSRGAPGQGI